MAPKALAKSNVVPRTMDRASMVPRATAPVNQAHPTTEMSTISTATTTITTTTTTTARGEASPSVWGTKGTPTTPLPMARGREGSKEGMVVMVEALVFNPRVSGR